MRRALVDGRGVRQRVAILRRHQVVHGDLGRGTVHEMPGSCITAFLVDYLERLLNTVRR